MVTSDLKDAYSFPITGSSWNVLWGQSVLISGSSLRGNIGAAILSRQASSSAGAGCYGTIVAEASSVRLPPIAQLLGVLERVRMDGVLLLQNPVLAGPSIVLWPDFSPRRLSMGDSHQEWSPLTGSGHDLSPPLGVVETVGVAPEGAQLIASGLSTEVAETILQSRAPSMRKLYALKLRLRVRRPPAWSS